jgi:hypothetical protein
MTTLVRHKATKEADASGSSGYFIDDTEASGYGEGVAIDDTEASDTGSRVDVIDVLSGDEEDV